MDNGHNCENCRYFIKHFARLPSGYFKYIGRGHCEHISQIKKVVKNGYAFNIRPECVFWELKKPQQNLRKEKFQQAFQNIYGSINEISILLENED